MQILFFITCSIGVITVPHADRLHMVTWNVATAEPPEDITSLLQLDSQSPTDLFVIGWETTKWKHDTKT